MPSIWLLKTTNIYYLTVLRVRDVQAASCKVLDGVSHDVAIKTSSEAAGVSRLSCGRTYDQVHSLEPLHRTASPPGSWLPPGTVIPESERTPKMEATVFYKTQYQKQLSLIFILF